MSFVPEHEPGAFLGLGWPDFSDDGGESWRDVRGRAFVPIEDIETTYISEPATPPVPEAEEGDGE